MEEIAKTESTGFSYIGEIARYLCTSPPSPYDKAHKIRFAFGNGLNKSIWNKFRERFNIPVIIEFYGSTEGNTFMRSVNTGPDGVGYFARRGPLLRLLAPTVKIVKQDPETLEPYRDPKTGYCIECDFDEAGEVLGEQVPIIGQSREYVDNKKANQKATMRDVFKKGDVWHRQGDLLKMNKDGWYEFVDRVGDTFRWRGENVSTMEVSAVMSHHPDIHDVTVYGITLPKYEGQVGMATVVSPTPNSVVNGLQKFMQTKGLPLYAHPRFVRFIDVIPTTQTHKHQKAQLKKESIDVYNAEPIYVLTETGEYTKMSEKEYKAVQGGLAKL
jgi:acyl-CoA synthetase (AMP-forming)/AMP-acid ligase II